MNITASDEPATIDTSSNRLGVNVTAREVKELPVNGRNFSQLQLLTPGATNTGTGNFNEVRFNGRSNQQNQTRLDGIESTAIFDSSPGYLTVQGSQFRLQTSLENIQEFRVDSSNYPAEYGTGTGGQINVVGKSGSNQFHGALFEYFRNDALDARNFFDGEREVAAPPQPVRRLASAAASSKNGSSSSAATRACASAPASTSSSSRPSNFPATSSTSSGRPTRAAKPRDAALGLSPTREPTSSRIQALRATQRHQCLPPRRGQPDRPRRRHQCGAVHPGNLIASSTRTPSASGSTASSTSSLTATSATSATTAISSRPTGRAAASRRLAGAGQPRRLAHADLRTGASSTRRSSASIARRRRSRLRSQRRRVADRLRRDSRSTSRAPSSSRASTAARRPGSSAPAD